MASRRWWLATLLLARAAAQPLQPAQPLPMRPDDWSPLQPEAELIPPGLGLSSQGGGCDPSWCDCSNTIFCGAQQDHPEKASCNLCDQKWLFVLSAGGRSGSTSILEGLNALPGVSLSGENLGLLTDMQREFAKVDSLVSRNKAKESAAFYLPELHGLKRHTLCAQQSTIARLAGANGSSANMGGGPDQIFGFKELVELRSFEAGGKFAAGTSHLEASTKDKREWVQFLEKLFPCSRIVFNLRRDRAAQARAILSSFGSFSKDPFGDASPPLTLVENDIEQASQFLLEMHNNRSATGRSFLMYTEDMTAKRFSELARWLDRPCTFNAPPTANEPDPNGKKSSYFHHSAQVDVSCGPESQIAISPGDAASFRETRDGTEMRGASSDAAPSDAYTRAYASTTHEDEDDACGEVELLPHNEVCTPQLSQNLSSRGDRPQLDLMNQRAPGADMGGPGGPLSTPGSRWESLINASDLPPFYIHEGGLFNFTDTVHCLFGATGLSADVDSFDDELVPDIAEHLVDWWLLKRFERHPARVHDPREAQLHVIGTPFTTAYRASRGFIYEKVKVGRRGPLGCGDLKSYYKRTAAIAQHLEQTSTWWKRKQGRDFLVLNSFYWLKDAVGKELLSTLMSGPSIFTTSDRNYVDFLAINATVTPTVIPYKAHYSLEDYAWLQLNAPPKARKYSVTFHGSTGRGTRNEYADGELRQLICDRLGPKLAHSSLHCIHDVWMKQTALADNSRESGAGTIDNAVTRLGQKNGQNLKSDGYRTWIVPKGRKADPETLKAYVNSKICLVPAGDTPTSRRLFDSMAAGCLPVLMAQTEDILPNLPFPHAIDWPRTVLFGGGLSCSLKDNADATVRWVQSLLRPENEEKLQCMARRAQRTFLKYLSLRDVGIVSAILHEIKHDAHRQQLLSSFKAGAADYAAVTAARAKQANLRAVSAARAKQRRADEPERVLSRAQLRSAEISRRSSAAPDGRLGSANDGSREPGSGPALPATPAAPTTPGTPALPALLVSQPVPAPAAADLAGMVGPDLSCAPAEQCGCLGQGRSTVFIRYHKTGCVLTRELMNEIDGQCGIPSQSLPQNESGLLPAQMSVIGAAAVAAKRCTNLKVALDGNNLHLYPAEVVRSLTRPREGVRFVHMLREPLRLVASYYAYHVEGAMGGENNLSYWTSFRSRLTNLSVSDGVAVVAQMLSGDQLPTMVSMHRQLVWSGRANMSGRGDVMEMRMEEFEADFNSTVASLLAHVGVSAGCAKDGQPLQAALARHDVYALSARERVQLDHTHWSAKRGSDMEAEALHALLHGNQTLRHSLKKFGVQLGYKYPDDTPRDDDGHGGGGGGSAQSRAAVVDGRR